MGGMAGGMGGFNGIGGMGSGMSGFGGMGMGGGLAGGMGGFGGNNGFGNPLGAMYPSGPFGSQLYSPLNNPFNNSIASPFGNPFLSTLNSPLNGMYLGNGFNGPFGMNPASAVRSIPFDSTAGSIYLPGDRSDRTMSYRRKFKAENSQQIGTAPVTLNAEPETLH